MKNKIIYIAILIPVFVLVALAVFGDRIPQKSAVMEDEENHRTLQPLEEPENALPETDSYKFEPARDKNEIIFKNESPEAATPKGPPQMQIDVNKKYSALMTTSEGVIKIELYADKTPITVNNFVSLSRDNFYNNVIFHRVIKGFMIQGGDPTGTGSGGPGYKFDDEPFDGEYTRGTVAMANAGPNTNGSQFFIMHEDQQLPKAYVIFGKVTEGMENVDKIATAEVTMGMDSTPSKPVQPARILGIEIIETD